MQTPIRIVFVGGGSGGHITPNLALIEYLLAKNKISKESILYVGSKKGMESFIVQQKGIPFQAISSGKLRRYFDWQNIGDIFRIIGGIFQSFFLLKKWKPQIIFSKGGFVSIPLVLAAWICKIPVITHESDIISGLANRLNKKFAQKICLTFAKKTYDKKEILTGLPVRRSLFQGSKEEGYNMTGFDDSKPVLLVMGGSLGASVLNHFIWNNLEKLLDIFQIVHLTGKGNKTEEGILLRQGFGGQVRNEEIGKIPSQSPVTKGGRKKAYIQYEFLDEELPHIYALSDLILSRAGATAIVEFSLLKKPSILVPLETNASRGEQILNAQFMEEKGGAIILKQKDLERDGVKVIEALLQDKEKQKKMKESLQDIFYNDACERIEKVIEEVLKNY